MLRVTSCYLFSDEEDEDDEDGEGLQVIGEDDEDGRFYLFFQLLLQFYKLFLWALIVFHF